MALAGCLLTHVTSLTALHQIRGRRSSPGVSCRLEPPLLTPPQSHLQLPPAYPKIEWAQFPQRRLLQGKMVSEELALASSLAKPGRSESQKTLPFRISSTLKKQDYSATCQLKQVFCCSISLLFLSPSSWLSVSASPAPSFSASLIVLFLYFYSELSPNFSSTAALTICTSFLSLDYAHICKHLNLRLGVFGVCFLLRVSIA